MRNDNFFEVEYYQHYTLIRVIVDKLDSIIAPLLKVKLQDLVVVGSKNIILDIGMCKYCDSSGLTILLVGNRVCKNKGGEFILTNINTAIDRLLRISQLITIIRTAEDLDTAIGFVDPGLKFSETYF
jgi:anti-anti-sigma factor